MEIGNNRIELDNFKPSKNYRWIFRCMTIVRVRDGYGVYRSIITTTLYSYQSLCFHNNCAGNSDIIIVFDNVFTRERRLIRNWGVGGNQNFKNVATKQITRRCFFHPTAVVLVSNRRWRKQKRQIIS